MKIILLDTNMLMAIGMQKVDIFSEIQRICSFSHYVAVLDSNVEELKKIASVQDMKYRKAAKLGLKILSDYTRLKKVKVLKTGKEPVLPADRAIIGIAESDAGNIIVATQDSGLKKKLKQLKIPLVVLRQKKYLRLEG